MGAQLGHVVETDHVVGERNHSLFGKVDAARRDTAIIRVGQAAIRPVAAWIEDPWEGTIAFAARTIQIAS